MIVSKKDRKNQYGYLSFTHSSNKNNVKLKHNIDPNDNSDCYVSKKILSDKRGKFGSKEFKDLRIDKEDKALINFIKRKK